MPVQTRERPNVWIDMLVILSVLIVFVLVGGGIEWIADRALGT
jgi:hypothetical protein